MAHVINGQLVVRERVDHRKPLLQGYSLWEGIPVESRHIDVSGKRHRVVERVLPPVPGREIERSPRGGIEPCVVKVRRKHASPTMKPIPPLLLTRVFPPR